jgi:hypothetical protein
VLVVEGAPGTVSGKRKTTGMNVQVACTINGCLARSWFGDKGYIGNNMLTPFRKPEGGQLLDWQKEFNKQINKIRYVIEQVIANFKTWRIMHTDYRRPLISNIPRNHLSRSRPALLRNRLNNPLCSVLSAIRALSFADLCGTGATMMVKISRTSLRSTAL